MSSTDDALSLAEQAEAEAAEAEAQAVAARERAAALRSRLDEERDAAAAAEDAEDAEPDDDIDIDVEDADETDEAVVTVRRRVSWPVLVSTTLAALLVCGLFAASGYLLWQHHQTADRQARVAEFSAAARQGVINLMSLDFNNGDADIKRLIDSTTGQFRDDFEKSKNDFLTVMKESKVVTKADVKATAVQSMTGDSAVVLVAASSEVSNSASDKQQPRGWRLSVTVEREDGQPKMSKVEFVP